jgi:hypothetical protein
MNQRTPSASTPEFFNTIGAKRTCRGVTMSALEGGTDIATACWRVGRHAATAIAGSSACLARQRCWSTPRCRMISRCSATNSRGPGRTYPGALHYRALRQERARRAGAADGREHRTDRVDRHACRYLQDEEVQLRDAVKSISDVSSRRSMPSSRFGLPSMCTMVLVKKVSKSWDAFS